MNVFIAGPRAISSFDQDVQNRLYSIYKNEHTVIVGDANGVDKSVQKFFFELQYQNVMVFACDGNARNNIGNWEIENVPVDKKLKGFDFYQQKDIAMSNYADYGFMIWNGESKGTFNNILNLIANGKKVLTYFVPKKDFILVSDNTDLENLLKLCPYKTLELYKELIKKKPKENIQLSIFDV